MPSGVLVILVATCVQVTLATNGEVQLIADLFKNYSVEARPVKNDSDAVPVKLGMALSQIVDVSEKNEFLSISVMLRQYWTDENLRWDPASYNGVSAINIRPGNIWKPDIVLYNNIDEDKSFSGSLDQLNNRVIVNYKGEIKWLTPVILSSKCPMNVQYFPFDTQICTLKFGSWTYDGFKVDIEPLAPTLDLGVYQKHSEWFFESGRLDRNVVIYGCCPEPFPDVTITITIKRRSLFYMINLVFPMVVISMLTMLSFYLPSESGERIALAITLLLAMTVFMLIVGEIIPPTSDTVPLVASFFSAVMVEMVLMIIILCYILKLNFKTSTDDPMPNWMRKIVLDRLSYVLGVRKRQNKTNPHQQPSSRAVHDNNSTFNMENEMEKKIKDMMKKDNNNHNNDNGHVIGNGATMAHNNGNGHVIGNGATIAFVKNGQLHRNNNDVTNTFENCFLSETPIQTFRNKEATPPPPPPPRSDNTAYLKLLSRKVDVFIQRFLDEDEENFAKEEWRICAMTLDKVSLIFFSVVFTVTSLGVFLNAPGYTP